MVGKAVLPTIGGLSGLLGLKSGGYAVGILVSGTMALVGKTELGAGVVGNNVGIIIGVVVGVSVIVGVMVGVLLGGKVGVTKTNPDSTVNGTC